MSIIYLMIIEGGHQWIPINIYHDNNFNKLIFISHFQSQSESQTFKHFVAVVAILQPNQFNLWMKNKLLNENKPK